MANLDNLHRSRPAGGGSCLNRVILASLGMFAGAYAVEPMPMAHAHNDYQHARPLLDALDHGFGSIEADVWLVAGTLIVAHDRKDTKPERTLAALYLDPLLARVRANGGRVYPGGPSIMLLVDVKSKAGPTYAALHVLLCRYVEMLTEFRPDGRKEGAVMVVVSGNRDQAAMAAQHVRLAALDGRQGHLDADVPADLVPLISENWRQLSPWDWRGPMPDATRVALADWVARAHVRGRRLRFWNVPDRPDVWQTLLAAGVDLVGSDNLPALQTFLRAHPPARAPDGAGKR